MPGRGAAARGRSELARALVALRGTLSQHKAAARTGVRQDRISRAETDIAPLDPAEAHAYALALGADEQLAGRIRDLTAAEQQRRAAVPHTRVSRDAVAIQRRTLALTENAVEILSWQERTILGNFQTGPFTQAMLAGDGGGDPGPEWWAARRARLALVDEPHRRWRQLIWEATLRTGIGSPDLMAAQCEHYTEATHRPNVTFGVIRLGAVLPFTLPGGFHIYITADGSTTVETSGGLLGAVFHDDPDDVAVYLQAHRDLTAWAVSGADAVHVCLDAAHWWRARR